MLDTSLVAARLARAREHATQIGLADSLERQLETLRSFGGNPEGSFRAVLYPDFAPHSFAFVIERRGPDGSWWTVLTGGLLFHGPHDGHGSGAMPTLAVTLEPVHGWSIHT